MDIALGIEALLPAAQYYGSTTTNTKEAFDELNWQDNRLKPSWEQIQDAYNALPEEIKHPEILQAQTKALALAKLAALGLSADEIAAL